MSSAIRRVVTGHDAAGRAIVLTDGPAPNVKVRAVGGFVSTLLRVTDGAPADISGTVDLAAREIGTAPTPSGTILRIVDFPPAPADAATRVAEAGGAVLSRRDMGAHGVVLTCCDPEQNPFQFVSRSPAA